MAEPSFGEDLRAGLELSQRICRIQIRRWRPLSIETMDAWQYRAIEGLRDEAAIAEIERAWRTLVEDPNASRYAHLLHEELRAVIDVQASALGIFDRRRSGVPDENLPGADASGRSFFLPTIFKRAAGSMKTFLDSLKDILEEVLGPWAKIAVQLAIEAMDLATK